MSEWAVQKDDARWIWNLWLRKNLSLDSMDARERAFVEQAIAIHLEYIKQPQVYFEALGTKDKTCQPQ